MHPAVWLPHGSLQEIWPRSESLSFVVLPHVHCLCLPARPIRSCCCSQCRLLQQVFDAQNQGPSLLRVTEEPKVGSMVRMTRCELGAGAEGVQDVQAAVFSAASGGSSCEGDTGAAWRPVQAAAVPASAPPGGSPLSAQKAQTQCAQPPAPRSANSGQHGGVRFLASNARWHQSGNTDGSQLHCQCHGREAGRS